MALHPFRDFMDSWKNNERSIRTKTELVGSTVSVERLTEENHNIRDLKQRYVLSPQADIGVFDQMVFVLSSLDKEIELFISPSFSGYVGPRMTEYIIPPGNTNSARFFFTSEVGIGVQNQSFRRLVEVPDLRQPYPNFRIYYQVIGDEPPTTGDIEIHVVRRF